MNVIRGTIRDKALVELTKGSVKAGAVLPNGFHIPTEEGTPQGGPLSPIPANIYLDRFDRLMESRGLHFIRYADDMGIQGRRACHAVLHQLPRREADETEVDLEKSSFGPPQNMKFPGLRLFSRNGRGWMAIRPKPLGRFRTRVRSLTERYRGRSLEIVIGELSTHLRVWCGNFGITTGNNLLKEPDGRVARRVRQYVFKQWKGVHTRFRNLRNPCPMKYRGPEDSVPNIWIAGCWWVAGMPSYRRVPRTPVMHQAPNGIRLKEHGPYFLKEGWCEVRERCSNHRVGVPTHGGVRGRTVN